MAGLTHTGVALVVLGTGSLATARRLQHACPGALIHGLHARVEAADHRYTNFGEHLRALYRAGTPIVALCAAGIVIRSLAAVLEEKGEEPPVLAVAEDGSAVVPLLGGLAGVNRLARTFATALGIAPAITTSGELRFGTCLLDPPSGYVLQDLEQGKRFVSDLLAGETVRVQGEAPWLAEVQLPLAADAQRVITVSCQRNLAAAEHLVIHPRAVLVAVAGGAPDLADRVRHALAAAELADAALGCLLADAKAMADPTLLAAARTLDVPLRFIHGTDDLTTRVAQTLPDAYVQVRGDLIIAVNSTPLDPTHIGQGRGRLAVIGLGPGAYELRVPAVSAELQRAQDVLGYETYVRMAGPFRDDQVLHCTDNREEMQRARHAFALAAQGRSVVVVSSGDPGVFAMAAAVLEALHGSDDPAWHQVDLEILPGVSASLATAAQAGAPLGHDFCVMSLSDNLKPWAVIEQRLDLAAQADLVLAFYNPISRSRPWQLGTALDIVRRHRNETTLVVLGRDIGRPGQTLRVVPLAELQPEMVDMRTMVLVGSSATTGFPRADGGQWVYTPRWYGNPP